MWRLGSVAVVLVLLLSVEVLPAYGAKRVALVIGNSSYVSEARLSNPSNDAREVAAALKRIRFDDVETVIDADLMAMQSALARFARRADGAELALVYYSGHGIEVDGKNYLIPISATLAGAGDVHFETVPLDLVIAATDRATKVKVIVLDACRSNPFRARMLKPVGTRSVGFGLARVEATAGMLVAYAARAGTVAQDGSPGGTSPFTTAFLKFVEQPSLEMRLMFGRVRDDVVRTTPGQEPFTYASLGGDAVFLHPGAPPLTPRLQPTLTEPERLWEEVRETRSIAVLEAFAQQFPGTVWAALARERIENIRKPSPGPITSQATVAEMQTPINNLFAAWNSLDVGRYIAQWAPDGVRFDLKAGTRTARAPLQLERERLFAQLSAANVYFTARLREYAADTAVFDVSYSLTMRYRTGRSFSESACETYRVERRGAQQWLIVINEDYAPCRW